MPEQRRALVELLGEDFDFSALTEVDEAIRLDIVDNLPNDADRRGRPGTRFRRRRLHPRRPRPGGPGRDPGAAAVHRADPAAARPRLSRKRSAGRRMQTEFVAVPPFWTVGQTIDYMRERQEPARRASARSSSSIRPSSCSAPSISTRSCAPSARSRSKRSCMRPRMPIPADDGPGRGGARIRAVRPALGGRRRRERAAGRRADHRRRGRRHPAGGRGGPAAHGRRRRRRAVRHRRSRRRARACRGCWSTSARRSCRPRVISHVRRAPSSRWWRWRC